jgi:hypothetical protein
MIIILDPIVLVPIADQAALVIMVVAEDHLEVAEEAEEDKQPVLTFNFDIKLNQPIKYEKYIFLLALGLSINNTDHKTSRCYALRTGQFNWYSSI